jgi:DNA-binding beta-propeller fold protein YncE
MHRSKQLQEETMTVGKTAASKWMTIIAVCTFAFAAPAQSADQIYYADIGVLAPDGGPLGVQRIDAGTGGAGYLSLVPHLAGRGRGLSVHPTLDMMFFAFHPPLGAGTGEIWTASKTTPGVGLATIATGLGRPRDVALDPFAGEVYWVDESLGTVEKVSIGGGPVTTILGGLDAPDSLCLTFSGSAVDFIYISAGGMSGPVPGALDGHIQRMTAGGGSLTTLMAPGTLPPSFRPRGIACDPVNGHLYFNDFGDTGGGSFGKTYRLPIGGGAPTLIIDYGDFGANDIDLDIPGGRIYTAHSVSPATFHGVKSTDFSGGDLLIEIDVLPAGGWFVDGLDFVPEPPPVPGMSGVGLIVLILLILATMIVMNRKRMAADHQLPFQATPGGEHDR